MSTDAWRVAVPVLAFLFNTGFTVSGWVNPTVAYVSWGMMVPVVLGAFFWPRIRSAWAWIRSRLGRVRFRWPVTVVSADTENRPPQDFGEAVIPDATSPGMVDNLRERIETLGAENKDLKEQRDAQLRARCFYLSERLRNFRENWEGQDRDMMDQYSQQFAGEVTSVVVSLKGFGWWDSEEHGHLAHPNTPQEIELLDYCLRDFGFGRL